MKLVVFRLAAGLNFKDIASELQRTKRELHHVPVTHRGDFLCLWVPSRRR